MRAWARGLGIVALAVAALVATSGCRQYVQAARAHKDARDRLGYVQRSNCAQNLTMLERAVGIARAKDPGKLDGVEPGSGAWFKILEREGGLPMAMPCMASGRYREGPGGGVECSVHGTAADIDTSGPPPLPSAPRVPTEVPDLGGEDFALGCWGLGLVCLLVSGYNYTAGGDDEDLIEALRQTSLSQPGAVPANAYALVEGVAEADENLLAPRARTHVVFYVYRQLEEWQEQDKNKMWHTRTRVLKEETEVIPFRVRGEGGAVEVAAGGARLEGKRLLRDIVGASGSATSHGGGGLGLTGKYRNHRYIHEVEGLEVGQPAVVIGPTAPCGEGGARFEARPQEERPYVVSARNRTELGQRAREGAGVTRLFMVGFGILAVIFLVAGFLIPTGS